MAAFPLIHISFAVADEASRRGWDGLLRDVFAARTLYEVLTTPESERLQLHRHQTLLAIGNTVLHAATPAGEGLSPNSTIGNMLRGLTAPNTWIGIALGVADLDRARDWVRERGWTPRSYPLLEDRYFLLDRADTLGVRLEFITGALANDPRLQPDWDPVWWRDEHPLGLVGLQSIGVSTRHLATAREVFGKLGWPEIGSRSTAEARCASFLLGDAVIEAMEPVNPASELAEHARDIKGIWRLNFEVVSIERAARYLESKGLDLTADAEGGIMIAPPHSFGRQLRFTEEPAQRSLPIPIQHLVAAPCRFESEAGG